MPRLPRALPLILVLLCGAAAAHAQGFAGGLRMGATVSTLRTDGPVDYTPAAGLAGGLWFEMPLVAGLRFQPELNYLTAGAHGTARAEDVLANPADPDRRLHLRLTYTYLQVPALLAWEPPLQQSLTPRLFAGPYVAFKQDAYVRFEDDVAGTSEVDERVHSRDYGVAFGGHVSLDTGLLGRLALGAEASVGLTDLRDSPVSTRNATLMLFFGLAF